MHARIASIHFVITRRGQKKNWTLREPALMRSIPGATWPIHHRSRPCIPKPILRSHLSRHPPAYAPSTKSGGVLLATSTNSVNEGPAQVPNHVQCKNVDSPSYVDTYWISRPNSREAQM